MNNILIPFPDKNNFKFFMENNIDGFIIGIEGYSETFNHLVKMSELNDICKMLKEKDKKIYIMLNKVYFNKQMEELKKIVRSIEKLDINALIFSDMAVLNIVREENLDIRLIWYSKLTTNSSTMKFLEKRGVSGFIISPEITLDEQIEISKKVNSPCSIKLFGYNIMATSSRKLITNYFKYCNMGKPKDKRYYLKKKTLMIFIKLLKKKILHSYLVKY